MILITFIALVIGLLAFYTVRFLKDFLRTRRLVSLLPGPKPFLCFGNLQDLICDDATLFRRLRKWGQQYCPVYKLFAGFTPTANISSPEDFEIIASTIKNIRKGDVYDFLDLWLGGGLLTNTGSTWQKRRKILTPAFHFNILQQFISVFNNETDNLVKTLKKECHKPHINIVPYITQFTLYTINETAMGTKLNLDNKDDEMYCYATHQIGKIFYYRMLRPWLYRPSIFYNFSLTGHKEKTLVKTLHYFTNRVIQDRAKKFEKFDVTENEEFNYSKRKKMAMLDLLLNAKANGLIDDKGIQDEVNTFMFEGHDTTSMSICFMLMLLASHKDVQQLILNEINEVLGESNSQPTYNNLQELKYTERCIKESLRLYPSVPYISRLLEEEVVTSTGYILPKDLNINIHIFDIHRNPNIWPDPEKFDPDRFLPENCQDRHAFAYVPFSAGPRNCIGQKFAILEIKAALCGIIKNFILEAVDTPETTILVPDIVLRTQNEIVRVKFIPRN